MPVLSTMRPKVICCTLMISVFGLTVAAADASAVSRAVRDACREDYFDYCNKYEVGSPALRQCMRKNQRRLSSRCVDALVASGEAGGSSRAYASRRSHRHREYRHD